jgi:hypothetical protein
MMSFRATVIRITTAATSITAMSILAVSAVSAQGLDEPIENRVTGNVAGAESQNRVESLADATDGLISEYRLTHKKIESLNIFNRQLSAVIVSQNEELESLQRQIDDVEEVGRAVTPLMLKMIDSLDRFVELDVPFLADKRKTRIDGLRVLMRRSDVADAERYRRILEAYQVENDFGRTIEAYAGTVQKDGADVPVDFLRIGRIGLLYQTRDGAEVGAWNHKEGVFETLDSSYFNWVAEGLRVAKKQSAPQLIRIPLPQPEKGGQS